MTVNIYNMMHPGHTYIYVIIGVILASLLLPSAVLAQAAMQSSVPIPSTGSISYSKGLTSIYWYAPLTGDNNGPAPDGSPNAACLRIAAKKPTIIYTYAYLWGWKGGDPPLGRDGSSGDWWYNGHWGGLKNLSSKVIDYLHSQGIKVIAYVPTFRAGDDPRYDRKLDTTDGIFAQIDRDLGCGVDGFFFDDVHTLLYGDRYEDLQTSSYEFQFYKQIHDYVKSKGAFIIVFNTGTFYNSENLMGMCDILSMEAAWKTFTTESRFTWRLKYDSSRFQGCNNHGTNSGLTLTSGLDLAVSLTLEAWTQNIGYHTSLYNCDGTIPDWYEDYMTAIGF